MITVDVLALREALKKVGLSVSVRTTLPIINSVLLDNKDNVLSVTGTNLETAVIATLPCIGESLSFCLPYKILNQFVSKGAGSITLTPKEDNKSVVLERSKIGTMNIWCGRREDFPPIPKMKNTIWSKLGAKEVCRLFGIVLPGCAKDESRLVLTGVCCRDGEIASADGFRLYNAKSEKFNFGLGELPHTMDKDTKIIPARTISEVIKIFGKLGEMQVVFDDSMVSFKTHDCTLVSQLIQGTYPKYEQLISKEFSSKVSFSVPLMVERLNLMDLSMGSGFLRLITGKEGTEDILNIRGGSQDLGQEEAMYDLTLPCKSEGVDARIGFNCKYFMDAIKSFSLCNLEMANPTSPGKFTGDIEGLVVILMPGFLQW
jgi:DNA polymerase-3 subunit beta